MEDLANALSNLDSVWAAWIAGGLALAFVSVIAYDSFRRNRRRRFASRSGRAMPAASPVKNFRTMVRSLDAEFSRRQRSRDRDLRR